MKIMIGNFVAFVALAVLVLLLQQMVWVAVLFAFDPALQDATPAALMAQFRELVQTTLWPFSTFPAFSGDAWGLIFGSAVSVALSLVISLMLVAAASEVAVLRQRSRPDGRTRLPRRRRYVNLESAAARLGVALVLSGAFLVPGAYLSLPLFGEPADLRSIKGQELVVVLETTGGTEEPLELMFRRYGSFDSGGDQVVIELNVQSEDVSITGFQVFARNLDTTKSNTTCYAQRTDGGSDEQEFFSDPVGELPEDVAALFASTSIYGGYYQFDDEWPDGDGWTRPYSYAVTDGVVAAGVTCVTYGTLAPLYANSVRYFPAPLIAVTAPGHDKLAGQFQDQVNWPGEWDRRDVRASSLDDSTYGSFSEDATYVGDTSLGGRFDPFMAIDTIDESTSTRLAWLGALLLGAWLSGILAILLDSTIGVTRFGRAAPPTVPGRPVHGDFGSRPVPTDPTPLDRRRLRFRRRFLGKRRF